MENWDWGNWYLSTDKGESWTKFRNLPKSVHVFDVAEWKGNFYMGVSDTDGAVVESPTGTVWKRSFGHAGKDSFGEVLSLVALPDALYAFWVEQWGAANLEANQKVDCYRFDGKTWEPRKLLPITTAVWNTKVIGTTGFILLSGRSYTLKNDKATPIPSLDGLALADVVEWGSDLLWLAVEPKKDYALYRTTWDPKKSEVGKVSKVMDLPKGLHGQSLVIHSGKVFVGCAASPSGELISIPLSALTAAGQ